MPFKVGDACVHPPEGQGCIDPDPCPSVYAQGRDEQDAEDCHPQAAPHRRFGRCVDAWFGRWIGHGWFECAKDPQDSRRPRGVVFSCAMKREQAPLILGIESSCDDTSAAVIRGPQVLSNVVANQALHAEVGGVVPEWASRAHLSKIQPVVEAALQKANVAKSELDAVAYTLGPGLQGSLHVGTSFAKAMAWSLDIPSIPVHHMRAHILAHVLEPGDAPQFPFLCLTVSGGHTQLVRVDAANDMSVLGQTLDDAAGEAFDKVAKLIGLPYPAARLRTNWRHKGVPTHLHFQGPRCQGTIELQRPQNASPPLPSARASERFVVRVVTKRGHLCFGAGGHAHGPLGACGP